MYWTKTVGRTRTLDRPSVWKWPTTDAMALQVPLTLRPVIFFGGGDMLRPGIHPTIATWPRLPKGTDHCSCEEYRCTHVDACVAKTWISYRCVPCHPWCTHRTSLVVKKTFSDFLWLWTIPLRSVLWFLVINVCNHGEHYETPCIIIMGTADGGTVVKELRYKSEGRWFDSRWCHWNFPLT
jgi:hypothetical protein